MQILSRIKDVTETISGITGTINSPVLDTEHAVCFSIQSNITVSAPSPAVAASATDVNITTNAFLVTAHGLTTGLKGQVSTSTTLPAPLAAVTDYFVIVVDANNFKLASSLAFALAGTAIDLTTTGTGNQTFTPTAIAGANVRLQKSNDGVNYIDDGSATNITASADLMFEKDRPACKYARLQYTLTAGAFSVVNSVISKG